MSQYDRYNHIDSIQCVYWVISVLPCGVAAPWGFLLYVLLDGSSRPLYCYRNHICCFCFNLASI
jgi:hypothetical protein